jgi:hypothetical protein
VDVLEELLRKYPDDRSARRLWVEVVWWRDHQNQIPWIPPAGDGSRFRRRMSLADPDGLAASESSESLLNQYRPPDPEDLPPHIPSLDHLPLGLEAKMNELMIQAKEADPQGSLDWSYLDAIERREIDVSTYPKWARDFLDDIDDPEERKYTEEMLLEQFSNKALYDDEYFEEDDEEDHSDDSHD